MGRIADEQAMNDLIELVKASKSALIALAASIAASCLFVFILHGHHERRMAQIRKMESRLSAMRAENQRSRLDLEAAEKPDGRYLRFRRFLGEPDRNEWMQRLEDIYRKTGLPANLRYTLLPGRPVDERPGNHRILYHELTMEISGMDDLEFLDFMERLSADWQIPYLVEGCQIVREQETDLEIRCTLQLYSMQGRT